MSVSDYVSLRSLSYVCKICFVDVCVKLFVIISDIIAQDQHFDNVDLTSEMHVACKKSCLSLP